MTFFFRLSLGPDEESVAIFKSGQRGEMGKGEEGQLEDLSR